MMIFRGLGFLGEERAVFLPLVKQKIHSFLFLLSFLSSFLLLSVLLLLLVQSLLQVWINPK